MKKIIFLLSFLFAVLTIQAQGPWKGFFKPIKAVKPEKVDFLKATALTSTVSYDWLFRPSLTLTALAFDLNTNKPLAQSLQSIGTGISYGKFETIDNTPYCDYSFNAALLTKVNINGENSPGFGGSLTVDVFNKTVGLGIGYLGQNGFANGHVLLLTSISYSF